MCQDKSSHDPCSCCPKIIVVQVIDVESEPVTLSEVIHQPVQDWENQYIVPSIPVPKVVKPEPVRVGVWF
jgi:hypothetical protein